MWVTDTTLYCLTIQHKCKHTTHAHSFTEPQTICVGCCLVFADKIRRPPVYHDFSETSPTRMGPTRMIPVCMSLLDDSGWNNVRVNIWTKLGHFTLSHGNFTRKRRDIATANCWTQPIDWRSLWEYLQIPADEILRVAITLLFLRHSFHWYHVRLTRPTNND